MNFNFELILFYLTLGCGVIYLIDCLFWAKKRKNANKKMPLIIDYARAFFPVLLLVFLIRSFLFEPFRIPSGSLKPTLEIGDFILVNKFHYGVRLPVVHKKIFDFDEPQRGDIVVFRWPPDPSLDFIKRIVGVPGDHISYINKTLYINGEKLPQTFVENTTDNDESGYSWKVEKNMEDLLGVKHEIYKAPSKPSEDFKDIVVPEGMYFAMGDNRDDSADSRYWGFVPEANIVGKASFIWMSWNGNDYSVRWKRLGTKIR
jgi:signal peptidase I